MTTNLDDLLDSTLDDLADLPSRKAFPPGVHFLSLKLVKKEINKKPAVEAMLTYKSTEEFSSPPDDKDVPKIGDESNVLYLLKNNDGSANEIAQGQLKNLLASIREQLKIEPEIKNGAIIDMCSKTPLDIKAVIGNRLNRQSEQMQTTLGAFTLV